VKEATALKDAVDAGMAEIGVVRDGAPGLAVGAFLGDQ
jgi:hypothetical protein